MAVAVQVLREVCECPVFVSIPRSHPILSGLAHFRSEFLPILNFKGLFPEQKYGDESQLLIIHDQQGDWGLQVDEVEALVKLETSDSPETDDHGWESTIVAWASYQDRLVRILDSKRYRQYASEQFTLQQSSLFKMDSSSNVPGLEKSAV